LEQFLDLALFSGNSRIQMPKSSFAIWYAGTCDCDGPELEARKTWIKEHGCCGQTSLGEEQAKFFCEAGA